jgi:hypothetical protein
VRDSTVIDSLSRLVPTEALYRKYRELLVSPDPAGLMQEIKCDEFALRWRYGTLPGNDAVKRMRDTVYRKEDKEAVSQAEARFPHSGMFIVSPQTCGITGPKAPKEIEGTSLWLISQSPCSRVVPVRGCALDAARSSRTDGRDQI